MEPKIWIKKIKFSDDTVIEFESNDVIVIVGPNNSGKSAYKENWETIVDELSQLREEMAEGRQEETEGISVVEAPFFDLLKNSIEDQSEEEINKTKELIHILMPILFETAEINNFWTKAAERKRVEGMIEDEIHYSGVEELAGKAAELTTEIMKLAKNRETDLK